MTPPPSDSLAFEQALADLERILRNLEDGTISLEDSLVQYERGVGLMKGCYLQLRNAEQRILKLVGVDEQGKPLLAVMHERRTAVDVMRDTNAWFVVTYPTTPTEEQKAAAAELLAVRWADVLKRRSAPATDWARFERYTSREMTRRQCEVFDDVVASRRATAA